MKLPTLTKIAAGVALAVAASTASANLVLSHAYQDSALSIDGFADTDNAGTIQADTPNNSTVEAAFLYASSVWSGPVFDVTLEGNTLTTASGTLLAPDENPASTVVWDVTSIIKPAVEGTWGLQDFSISEAGANDGAVLVVVYSDATTTGQTSIIMDGELATTGDTTTLGFADPYVSGDLIVSFASSFSFQVGSTSQSTVVDITTDSTVNRNLTTCLGGQDESNDQDSGPTGGNSALMTVGGIGDDPTNPDCSTLATPTDRTDDELYNLALGNASDPNPFINPGDTFLQIDTNNPSNDDNVFAMFITSSFTVSNVDNTDITGNTPIPGSVFLLGLGLVGIRRVLAAHRS